MIKLMHNLLSALALFMLSPFCLKATLPWYENAASMAIGGSHIVYDINPVETIGLSYIMPYQLKELSIRRLKAGISVKNMLVSFGLGQSGDDIFSETIFSIGTGKKLSEKMYMNVTCGIYHVNMINGVRGNALLPEIVFLYQPVSYIMIGTYLFNPAGSAIINKVRDFKLNQSFHLGCSVFPVKNLSFIMELGKELGGKSTLHIGSDYKIMNALELRMGFSGNPFTSYGGFGCKYRKFDFSSAVSYHPVLGISSGFSIRYFLKGII